MSMLLEQFTVLEYQYCHLSGVIYHLNIP